MRKILVIGVMVAAALAAGCASDKEYLKAQADAAVADGNARVAEANARAEEARAIIALAPKIDAGGAASIAVVGQLKEVLARLGPRVSATRAVDRPRDFIDYLNAFTGAVGALGNVAVPIITVRENGKTQRELYHTNVDIEQARQVGETGRIQSVAQIARDVAAGRPNTTINVGRDATLGGNQSNNNSTTTTTNCNGGTGAAGGAGGAGGGTTTGAQGGSAGAGGGAAGGNC